MVYLQYLLYNVYFKQPSFGQLSFKQSFLKQSVRLIITTLPKITHCAGQHTAAVKEMSLGDFNADTCMHAKTTNNNDFKMQISEKLGPRPLHDDDQVKWAIVGDKEQCQ